MKDTPDRARDVAARRWAVRGALGAAGAILAGTLGLIALFSYYGRNLPDVHGLGRSWRPPQTTRVLGRDGTVLAELFTERRTVVPLANLPAHLVKALLAAEDAEFYAHRGLDYPGMVRALFKNLQHGTVAQGASTITQQVVKNVLLTPERTLGRKVREVVLARRIEAELSKDEILFLYVNHIAFGHGRNGVEEAARYYFGKHVGQLTLGESALLAGIPKSPVRYSPRNNPEAALRRRRWILGQMVRNSFITQAQADAAAAEPIRLVTAPEDAEARAPEIVEVVRRTLVALAGEDALRGGYTVTTTIDPAAQRAAREAVTAGLLALDERHGYRGPLLPPGARYRRGPGNVLRGERPPRDGRLLPGRIYRGEVAGAELPDPARHQRGELLVRVGAVTGRVPWPSTARYRGTAASPADFAPVGAPVRVSVDAVSTAESGASMHLELGPQAALVAIDPQTREVRAMVGAFEAVPGMFNRATRALRQPGSAFKPFLYSFALASRRFTPASTMDPNPGCFGTGRTQWCPHEGHARPGEVAPPMRLRDALAISSNMVAARLMDTLGPDAVISHARALGVHSELPRDLSLALGSGSVTPIELTNGFASFAAGGRYQDTVLITRVIGPDGRELRLPERAPPRQAIGPAEAYLVTSLMTSVVTSGTGARARALRRPVAGKTGTTDRNRDAWFVAFTPDLVAGVWVGFDDRQPLGFGEEGGRAAAPIWTDFMRAYVRARRPPAIDFPRPDGVVAVRIDRATGMLAPPGATDALEEVFLAGTEPQQVAPTDAGMLAAGDAAVIPGTAGTTGGSGGVITPAPTDGSDGGGMLVLPVQEVPVEGSGGAAPDGGGDDDEADGGS